MSATKKNSSGFTLLPLLLILFCLCPVFSVAQETATIGKIIALRGKALAGTEAGISRSLAIGSEIAVADVIITGRRCRLQIIFADSSIVSLGPASNFVVKEYAWDAQTRQGKMTSRINEGVFRVLGGSITRTSPQNFITETPSATIGIRGSMYAGRVRDGQLQVVFQGGKGIYVRNSLGRVEISTPGFGTRLTGPEQPPETPYPFSPQELELLDPVVAVAPPLPMATPSRESGVSPESVEEAAVQTDAAAEPEPTTTEPPVFSEEPAPVTEPFAEPLPPVGEIPAEIEPPAQTVTTDTLLPSLGTDTLLSPIGTGGTATVSGRFTAVQDDLVLAGNIADLTWLGSLSGQTSTNNLTGTAATNNGTFAISPFVVNGYDPLQTYTGSTKQQNVSRTVTLLGSPVAFNTATISTDNTGEFSVFTLKDNFAPGYLYSEIGFLGTPTLSTDMPTTGFSQFSGPTAGSLTSLISTDFETIGGSFKLAVNWHNGKVMGAIIEGTSNDAVGFFIGDVSGTGFNTSLFFGNDIVDLGPGPILAISGTDSFAQFYGNQFQGVGFDLSGSTHNVLTQATEEDWLLTGAGFRTPTINPTATGSVLWEGFVVGVGEDMNQIDVDRRLFMNTVASEFSLNINRDTGNINGSLDVADIQSAADINSLTLGGGTGSAYVSDQVLATGIGGTPIINGVATSLKTYGNYLMPEDPSRPLASYVSWGHWEIAYTEPGSSDEYHVHMPGSYWVAGKMTTAAELGALNFSATYDCQAEGVLVPPVGQFNVLPTGTVILNVDFAAGALTSGSINFPSGPYSPALNLLLDPTSISSTGFSALVTSPDVGSVNGAFYGPAAESAAGNFEVMVSTDRFIGVFGGDR